MDQYREIVDYLDSHLPDPLKWLIPLVVVVLILGNVPWLRTSLKIAFDAIARPFSAIRRREGEQHRAFVDSLTARLNQINANADWTDRHYAELEAQVESRVAGTPKGLFRLMVRGSDGLRRENLGRALQNHPSQFILLQGSPGSGKSVALRHVAIAQCKEARRGRPWARPVPLYVNLRDFKPAAGPISAETITDYILTTLSSLDHSRQSRYAKENFDMAVSKGGWFFLFDGFDEIPDVLAAVQVDATIRRYADALSSFCADVATCRSVIASRDYRGPQRLDWPRLEIVGLNEDRQRNFVRRARLGPAREALILQGLPFATSSVQQLIDNPMFLGLVVSYVEQEGAFPATSHEVFESYAAKALAESEGAHRFGIDIRTITEVAEEIAYCMSADSALGLSATVSQIAQARLRLNMAPRSVEELGPAVASLTSVRLTRTDETFPTFNSTPISFSHRRFQEYFATRYVLAHPRIVSPQTLLTDGRWRETAVTILQTQDDTEIKALLDMSVHLLEPFVGRVGEGGNRLKEENDKSTRFAWPPNVLHVLSIIEDGIGRSAERHHAITAVTESILLEAAESGIVLDKRWALDVSGPLGPEARIVLLRACLRSGSEWLREGVFRQMRRVAILPKDISRELAFALITFSVGGRLRRDRASIRAQIANLREPQRFVTYLWLLSYLPLLDLVAHIPLLVPYAISGGTPNTLFKSLLESSTTDSTIATGALGSLNAIGGLWTKAFSVIPPIAILLLLVLLSSTSFYGLRASTHFSWSVATSKARGFFELTRGLSGVDTLAFGYLMLLTRAALEMGNPTFGDNSMFGVFWVILQVYCLTWAPSCLAMIRRDRGGNPFLAVVLPQFSSIVAFAQFILDVGRSMTWKEFRRVIIMAAILAAILFIMHTFGEFVLYISFGVLAVFGLFLLILIVLALIEAAWWVRDVRKFRQSKQNPHAPRNAEEFVELLCAYHSAFFTIRAVRVLRDTRNSYLESDVTESMEDLAWAIDHVEKHRPRPTFPFSNIARDIPDRIPRKEVTAEVLRGLRGQPLREWFEKMGPKGPSRLRGLGPSMGDELGRALEQVSRASHR